MNRLYFDFETRSECNIKTHGAWLYAKHPSTIPLCLAYAINDEPVKLLDKEFWEYNTEIPYAILKLISEGDYVAVAHNAFFEQSIWRNILVKRFSWPDIPIEKWVDTMAKARVFSIPGSLKGAGDALDLSTKKDKSGEYLVPRLCSPKKPSKKDPGRWDNDPEKMESLFSYCMDDVRTMRLLDHRLPDLNDREKRVWIEDQRMNFHGVPVDLKLGEACLGLISSYNSELNLKLNNLTNHAVQKASALPALKRWLSDILDEDVEFLDKAAIAKYLNNPEIPEYIKDVLAIRQQLGKSSVKKYQRFIDMTDPEDNRSRQALEYHRATTGRWGGRGIQMHNLPRGNAKFGFVKKDMVVDELANIIKHKDMELMHLLFNDAAEVFSSAIRGMIVPDHGQELFCVDYAQIEARVLMWLAGEQEGLELFVQGLDPYLDMAKKIFDNPNLTKENNNSERQLGKCTILGAGYQMGWKRFKEQAATPPYFLTLDDEMAKQAIGSYRSTYSRIRDFWYAMNDAAMEAVRTSSTVECGKIKFGTRGGFLLMQLPSKRFLAYYKPINTKREFTEAQRKKIIEEGEEWRLDKIQLTYMTEENRVFKRTAAYGGMLVEHATQAIARDIMANGLINISDSGKYTNLLTVHDECITQAPIGSGSVEEVIKLMTDLPEWAEGCPIEAEGWKGLRYHK